MTLYMIAYEDNTRELAHCVAFISAEVAAEFKGRLQKTQERKLCVQPLPVDQQKTPIVTV